MSEQSERPLAGKTIALLEARRSQEIARLIEIQGGRAHVAPLLREVPTDDPSLQGWIAKLSARRFDVVVFLTGVGCQVLLERARESNLLPTVLEGLAAARVVARGPKPVRVLKELGVRVDFVPPEPNTSDELIAELTGWDLQGKILGLQLYGGTTPYLERLRSGLASLGAQVEEVLPYRWEGPTDEAAVRTLIDACLSGAIDALAIFSSSQIHLLLAAAEEHDHADALRAALNDPRMLVAAVGPVSAEAVESHGVHVDLQPEHPKMGHLILALAQALGPSR